MQRYDRSRRCEIMENYILTEVDVVIFNMTFEFIIVDGTDAHVVFCYPTNDQHRKNSFVWIFTLSIIRTSSESWPVAMQSCILRLSTHF